MCDSQDQFKARIQDFLNFHFPNDKHTFKEYIEDYYVTVGEEKNAKLIFNVVGSSIYRLTINKEHFDTVAPIFGLDVIDRSKFEVVNDFLMNVNNNVAFKEIFEPVDPIDFSKLLVLDLQEAYGEYEVDDSLQFMLQPKFSKRPLTCTVQFDWHFVDDSNNTKLKGLVALCLTVKQAARFPVGFDVDSKAANLVTAASSSYNNFFENNDVLNLDVQLEPYLRDFASMWIQKHSKEVINTNDMAVSDMVKLLSMVEN